MRRLIRVCTVSLNYRSSGLNETVVSLRWRQSTHQCCPYFDLMFCSDRCIMVVCNRSCQILWSPCRGSLLFASSLVFFFFFFFWYRLWYVTVAILRHLLIYFAYNYLCTHAYVRLYVCDVLVWFIDVRLYWTLLHVLRWNVWSDKSRCKMFSTVQNITKTCLFKYIGHFTK